MANGENEHLAPTRRSGTGDGARGDEQFRSLAELGPDAVIVQCDGVVQFANDAAARLFDAESVAVLEGMNSLDLIHPNCRRDAVERRDRVLSDGRPAISATTRHMRLNGIDFHSESNVGPIAWNGRPGTVIVIRDVTARREAEESLRESEERFRDVVDASSSWLWETDPDLRLEWISELGRDILGEESEQLLGGDLERLGSRSQDSEHWWRHLEDLQNRRPIRDFAIRWSRPSGAVSHIRLTGKPLFDRERRFKGYRGIGQDVTSAVEGDRLRQDLRDAIEHVPESFALFDADDRFVACNAAFRNFSGLPAGDLAPGLPFEAMLRRRIEAGVLDRELAGAAPEEWIAARMAQHRDPGPPIRVRVGDRWRQVHEARLPNGGTTLTSIDITDSVRREDELRESQKMDAVGRLTGGIAHDFNNLLAVIIGNIELVLDGGAVDSDLCVNLQRAAGAAARGGALTQRLLAFSRRQTLAPEPVDLRSLVDGMADKLRRCLGDEIGFAAEFAVDLWDCHVDPVQLAGALMNLAINARELMPDGGRLSILARNRGVSERHDEGPAGLTPGDYVALSVADSGLGMPADVAERAFEPFFTTKDVGAGAGLGLSAVFGFMRQSDGHAVIRSRPGEGTTVELLIPRSTRRSYSVSPATASADAPVRRTEDVLVVEDDDDVRDLLVAQMKSLGYAATGTATANEALKLIDGGQKIDLLLTDVVLPGGMGGLELARQAKRLRPDLAILFMSGYAEIPGAGPEKSTDLLEKPFTRAQLAERVRRVLDPDHSPTVD